MSSTVIARRVRHPRAPGAWPPGGVHVTLTWLFDGRKKLYELFSHDSHTSYLESL